MGCISKSTRTKWKQQILFACITCPSATTTLDRTRHHQIKRIFGRLLEAMRKGDFNDVQQLQIYDNLRRQLKGGNPVINRLLAEAFTPCPTKIRDMQQKVMNFAVQDH